MKITLEMPWFKGHILATAAYLSCVTDKAALGVTSPQRYQMPTLQCLLDGN